MDSPQDSQEKWAALPYVVPFFLYVGLTALAARLMGVYPWAYTAAVVLVGASIVVLLRGRNLLRPHFRIAVAILVGLIGIVLWIVLSGLGVEEAITSSLPWLKPPPRAGFDPFTELPNPAAAWAFIAVRLIGLVILVPIAEELFWRGFLWRWVISADWEQVPLGAYSWRSFVVVTICFTAAHPEWLAAAVYCVLLNGLLIWKKDLWSCIVAHAVSNLVLAIYVLVTGAWWLW